MNTIERTSLTLDDLAHDSERDRPAHLRPKGSLAGAYPQALCGARAYRPEPNCGWYRPLCVVCNELYSTLYGGGL
jgi:hypothetical protein